MRRKAIPREKKSNVNWKCEVVQNYSVTGNLEKMYSFVSDFPVIFHRSLYFRVIFYQWGLCIFRVIFYQWPDVHHTTSKMMFSHSEQLENVIQKQKQPQRFFKIGVLKTSQTSQENICVGVSFKKVAGLKLCKIVKKETPRQVFPVNFSKFLRTPLFTEHLRWLLLVIISLTPDSLHWVNRRFCLNALLF